MTDLVKTRDQLKQRAALNLALIEPGEALSSEDDDTLDGLIDPLLAQLREDNIVYIGDTDNIELQFFLPLASILANIAGPSFGSPINVQAKFDDERTLRRLRSSGPTYEQMRPDYF